MIKNPILRGFCPDPSIIKANGKYYIATSTFEWWPGVGLFESTDLKHWKQIRSPLHRESQLNLKGDPASGGVWAPCLSFDGARFYLVYTDVKTKKGRFYNTNNYVVTTDDIYGEWSDPVYLNSIGFDPSLFHDDDGRKYLVNMINGFKGITVQEIDPATLRPIGERIKVYEGSGIGCCEGPHIYHIGSYYYLFTAEGGTGYDHVVTVARAGNVYDPYETCPDNPLLTSDKNRGLQKCGHADIVKADNGEWYLVHLCARPSNEVRGCILGRECAIQEIVLDEDGFFRTKSGSRYCMDEIEEPALLRPYPYGDEKDFRDDFSTPQINVRYRSPRRDYNTFAYTDVKRQRLIIRGEESLNSLHDVSLIASRQCEKACTAATRMYFKPEAPEHLAGLVYMYDNMNFYILGKTKDDAGNPVLVLLKSDKGDISDIIEPVGLSDDESVDLKIETDGITISFFYGNDGNYTQLPAQGSTEILTDEYCRGFTGAHFGMYVHDMLERKAGAEFGYFSIVYHE